MLVKILELLFMSAILAAFLYVASNFLIRIVFKSLDKDFSKFEDNKLANVVVIALCLCLSVYYSGSKLFWGNNTIGDFLSKNEFDTQYYVQMFPDKDSVTNYYVPADLHVIGGEICIDKVYWPDGSHTTFYEWGASYADVLFSRKRVTLPDDEGVEWNIVLTEKKVEQ